MNKFKIVKIDWVDATTIHDVAYSLEEAIKWDLVKATTVGYLIHEDKKKVILCNFIFEDVGYKTIHVIPKNCITDRKVLK